MLSYIPCCPAWWWGEDGIFRHVFCLEKDAFILYRVEKK